MYIPLYMLNPKNIHNRKIKSFGNSSHILLPKCETGKDAVIIIIDNDEPMNKEQLLFQQIQILSKKIIKIEREKKELQDCTETEVLGKDKNGHLILGKEKKLKSAN